MDGLLLIDKPTGWTSFDVVAKVRGLLKADGVSKPKVGHTGTLDPLATGLLVLCLGSYCKRAQEFAKLDKTYEVTTKLGLVSSTGDDEGQKTAVADHQPTRAEIHAALHAFLGAIQQTPPAYSAIKVDGQRAYKLARAGKTVTLEPRPVTIYSLKLTGYDYPEIKLTAKVSSGTYIRALVEDIGTELHTGAYLSALRRTSVGNFELGEAISLEGLKLQTIYDRLLTP